MSKTQRMPAIETIGTNPTKLWGLSMEERHRRIGAANGYDGSTGDAVLLVNAAYVADPAWVRHLAANPGLVLSIGGTPALAHAVDKSSAEALRQCRKAWT